MIMDDEETTYYLCELMDDVLYAMIQDMEKNRHNPDYRQAWKVIPSNMLIKEWNYNAKTGLTHDKIIEKMEKIIVNNYLKLYINTVLSGHTGIEPFIFAENALPEDMKKEDFDLLLEDTDDYICDENGAWRLSDYGLDKIGNYVNALVQASEGKDKLYLIDRILNVVHQRSDLSSWFIEGGKRTLCELFRKEDNDGQ